MIQKRGESKKLDNYHTEYGAVAPIWIGNDIIVAASSNKSIFVDIATKRLKSNKSDIESLSNELRSQITFISPSIFDGLVVKQNGEKIAEWRNNDVVSNPRVSPLGNYVTFGIHGDSLDNYDWAQGLTLWDRRTGKLSFIAGDCAREAAFSQDEKWLLYGKIDIIPEQGDENIYMWSICIRDMETGNEKQLTPKDYGRVRNLAWSSNGLICFNNDYTQNKLFFYRIKLKSDSK